MAPTRARAVEIHAPADQIEGTRSQVSRWLKAVGDTVREHEPLIEIETDKVTVEVAAPASGVLLEIVKGEQEDIAPGEVLGRIGLDGDGAVAAAGLSPAVRRLLAERGLDPSVVRGSGEGGRITVDDVLACDPTSPNAQKPARAVASAQSAGTPARAAATPSPTAAPTDLGPVRVVPHTAVRKRIAEHMVQSLLHTAPHVTTVFEADMSAVIAHRSAHKAEFEKQGAPLTFTAYFVAACVQAIRAVPEANSRWTDTALEIYAAIHIGVATAIEAVGLMVPVLRNVESKSLLEIARDLNERVVAARAGKLQPADVRGGTFTISNHGVSGSLLAAPIVIQPPQAAILGVGKLEKRAVVVEESGVEKVVVQPKCYVTLTLDHRVMDGHQANRFLQVLVRTLESWPAP